MSGAGTNNTSAHGPSDGRHDIMGYIAAAAIMIALSVIKVFLILTLPSVYFEVPDVLAVGLIAYLYGHRPGYLATALSTFVYYYLYIPPSFTFFFSGAAGADWMQVGWLFLGDCVAVIAMSSLRESRQRIVERTRQLEHEMRESRRAHEAQARLAAIVESSEDAIIGKTLDGIIFSWNEGARRMYGYTEDEVVGKDISILLPPDHPDEAPRILESIVRGEPVGHYETERMTKGGRRIQISLTVSPIRDAAGNIIAASTIARDITEQKQAEEEIRRLNVDLEKLVEHRTSELQDAVRELEAFSYSVSHDLRAPLRAIDGFSNTLLKYYRDSLDERGQDYLGRVRAAAQRMGQLIDDILGLSRAGRAEMHRQQIDISTMASDILAELQSNQPERKAEFVVAPGLIANADDHLIRIALTNLLGNAWKFTARQDLARIEVGKYDENGEWVYFVKDNGVGFNPEYADKLFLAFQRLHSEADFPGTGIGLALVQRILRRHGGRVWARSAVNQGATFYFTLGEQST